ncbi:MAG: ammonium transporter [Candidatus Tectomicrobia bacterium]|nr:ammonium transporter [Candidatus Tectomicrobia bacterium]
MSAGDTAWVLMSSALVLMMVVPGLALFYGGLVRRKNVLGTLMQSFILLAMLSLQWVLWGYTVAFGSDIAGLFGSFEFIGLAGVGAEPREGETIPHLAFMIFQGMFAAITPALITGAFAERMKFKAFLIFGLLWAAVVYDPLAHWVWGGGWIGAMGALDFAGGTVVHISSGVSALVCAFVLGRRRGWPHEYMPPHNLPFTVIGAALLWVGWFGFNAGSALGANGAAANAFVTTNTAASAAAFVWMLVEWRHSDKPTVLGVATGAVAGLVAITPGAGFVGPMSALIIGAVAAIICFYAIVIKTRLGYDDSLDVVGVHGVGGTWGALATGLFASAAVGGTDGLFFGNAALMIPQIVSVIGTVVYAGVLTWIILKILDVTMGLRVSDEDEQMGLDLSQHNESAYTQ